MNKLPETIMASLCFGLLGSAAIAGLLGMKYDLMEFFWIYLLNAAFMYNFIRALQPGDDK